MDRHELALHSQAFAIEPLVMIAELARRQGLEIFDLEEHKRHLSDAIGFLSRAIADPRIVKKYTPEEQQIDPDLRPGSNLLGWAEFWNAYSPDPAWQDLLQKPLYDRVLGGSATLYAAPVSEKPQPVSADESPR